jgi:hypothetical protein
MRVASARERACLEQAAKLTRQAKADLRSKRRCNATPWLQQWDRVDEFLMKNAFSLANQWSIALEVER